MWRHTWRHFIRAYGIPRYVEDSIRHEKTDNPYVLECSHHIISNWNACRWTANQAPFQQPSADFALKIRSFSDSHKETPDIASPFIYACLPCLPTSAKLQDLSASKQLEWRTTAKDEIFLAVSSHTGRGSRKIWMEKDFIRRLMMGMVSADAAGSCLSLVSGLKGFVSDPCASPCHRSSRWPPSSPQFSTA